MLGPPQLLNVSAFDAPWVATLCLCDLGVQSPSVKEIVSVSPFPSLCGHPAALSHFRNRSNPSYFHLAAAAAAAAKSGK